MKNMKIKSAIAGIVIIALMLGSTLAYSVLQSVKSGATITGEVTLPTTNIVDHEMTTEQETKLLGMGFTLLKLQYNLVCENCLSQLHYLESLTSSQNYKSQIILEEISTKDVTSPKLEIISMYGQNSLNNATQDKIIESVCNLMIQPPLDCTLREV